MGYRLRRCLFGMVLACSIATSQNTPRSSLELWRTSIRGILTGPDADRLYVNNYKDADFTRAIRYFEGAVVSVIPARSGGRTVLLSIEKNGVADAALDLDGELWILKSDPAVGTLVRFNGILRKYTKEPFLVTFLPRSIAGLDVEEPFRAPGGR